MGEWSRKRGEELAPRLRKVYDVAMITEATLIPPLATARDKQSLQRGESPVFIRNWLGLRAHSDPEPAPIDFRFICKRLSREVKFPQSAAMVGSRSPNANELETFAERTIRGLRSTIESQDLHVDLLELAVIDNDSLQQITSEPSNDGPRFVSVVSAFHTSQTVAHQMLQSWHGAIDTVIKQHKESIVGSPDCYRAICFQASVNGGRPWVYDGRSENLTSAHYWITYPFGMKTLGADARLTPPSIAEEQAGTIFNDIGSALCVSFSDALRKKMSVVPSNENTPWHLMVVPFRRPFPWKLISPDRWALPLWSSGEYNERCGGCLFALVTSANEQIESRELALKIEAAASRCQWILARAAMHEALLDRASDIGEDFARFTHTTAKFLRGVIAPLSEARQLSLTSTDAHGQKIKAKIVSSISAAERMESLANAYRAYWTAVRKGEFQNLVRADTYSTFAADTRDMLSLYFNLLRSRSKDQSTDVSRTSVLDALTYNFLDIDSTEMLPVIGFSKETMRIAIVELMANAIEHADWLNVHTPNLMIRLQFGFNASSEELQYGNILFFVIENPIHDQGIENLRKLFSRDIISLGLATIRELVASVRHIESLGIPGFVPNSEVIDGTPPTLRVAMPLGVRR